MVNLDTIGYHNQYLGNGDEITSDMTEITHIPNVDTDGRNSR